MKKLLIAVALSSLLLVVAGCGASHHTITKTDGTSVVSVGEPEYSKDSSTYTFENLDGEQETIKREDVKDIKENKK